MINTHNRSAMANCIVLHDFERNPGDLRGWFEYTLALFHQHGVTPTKASSSGVNGTKSRKNLLFKNEKKKLELCHFQGINSIWFGANPPDHFSDGADVLFSTHLSLSPFPPVLVLCVDDAIVPWKSQVFTSLAQNLSHFFGARYGYFYQRLWIHGPDWFSSGIDGFSGKRSDKQPSAEDCRRNNQWGLKYISSKPKYRTGDLRDIYPISFLCGAHLTCDIGGQTFEAWVKADTSRGRLTPLEGTNPGLWAWEVEASLCETVRKALLPSGMILCV
jgi:hypothetical protein